MPHVRVRLVMVVCWPPVIRIFNPRIISACRHAVAQQDAHPSDARFLPYVACVDAAARFADELQVHYRRWVQRQLHRQRMAVSQEGASFGYVTRQPASSSQSRWAPEVQPVGQHGLSLIILQPESNLKAGLTPVSLSIRNCCAWGSRSAWRSMLRVAVVRFELLQLVCTIITCDMGSASACKHIACMGGGKSGAATRMQRNRTRWWIESKRCEAPHRNAIRDLVPVKHTGFWVTCKQMLRTVQDGRCRCPAATYSMAG